MPRKLSPVSKKAAARPLPPLQSLAAFEPTPTQRRFVQLAVANDTPLRISAVCQQLGIARSTYYRWLDDDAFRGWMALQWAQTALADGGRLLSIARLRAETDYRYFKSLLELIFDPRGLGLLATWAHRMAASGESATGHPETHTPSVAQAMACVPSPDATPQQASSNAPPAPLFTEEDVFSSAPEPADAPSEVSTATDAPSWDRQSCLSSPAPDPTVPQPSVPAPVKSTTYDSAALQNANSPTPGAEPPGSHAAWVPGLPPAWPNPSRFR